MDDKMILYLALNYWANHIETGEINISANDAYDMGEENLIKRLDITQKKFVIRLRELAEKQLK